MTETPQIVEERLSDLIALVSEQGPPELQAILLVISGTVKGGNLDALSGYMGIWAYAALARIQESK